MHIPRHARDRLLPRHLAAGAPLFEDAVVLERPDRWPTQRLERVDDADASARGQGDLGGPLVPLTLAFFAGRLVSYSLYVGAASAAKDSLGSVFSEAFASPLGIALQLAMLAAIVLLLRIDWSKRLGGGPGEQRARPAA
jgi:hypothetical protein